MRTVVIGHPSDKRVASNWLATLLWFSGLNRILPSTIVRNTVVHKWLLRAGYPGYSGLPLTIMSTRPVTSMNGSNEIKHGSKQSQNYICDDSSWLCFIFQDTDNSSVHFLCILIQFIFAMKDRLRNINENSYNNFLIKAGKWLKNLFYLCRDIYHDINMSFWGCENRLLVTIMRASSMVKLKVLLMSTGQGNSLKMCDQYNVFFQV